MKLFSCSKDILEILLSIFKELPKEYFAHLSKDKLEKETLLAHSELVSKYCTRLIDAHNLEPIIDSLIEMQISLLPIKCKKEFRSLFKEIFIATIVYHDLGKVNPNFQVQKMENNSLNSNTSLSLQSNHSILSAYLFSNVLFKKTFENTMLNDDEKLILYFSIHLFSATIIKHHNTTIDFSLEFEKEKIYDCYSFLETYNILLDKNFCLSFYTGSINIFEEFSELAGNLKVYFNFFAITKLLYSLLTASDFYATNEFMAKFEVSDFGVLNKSEKQKIIDNFKTVRPYNNDLFTRFEYYQSIPFENLTERNNANLNILRQKLTAEVVTNVRKNILNKCFYLEAPTGAGKTNISLAFVTELMNVDSSLNKVLYVFPYTTLITQTFISIRETLDIDNNTIIQLHSKAMLQEKGDGTYGNEKRIYLDNLFVNFPIALLSHISFFEILKGNEKESNYLLHRLCNSIIIIDEIQTYNPEHWDKIVFFLANYSNLFNIRILIMSATLPKIDVLHESLKGTFISLLSNRNLYFSNENFAGRVSFDFTLLDKKKPDNSEKVRYLNELSDFMINKTENYANLNDNKVNVLIEFITKKTAALYFSIISKDNRYNNYKVFLLSGDILEYKRKQIIKSIKEQEFTKVIVVSTQVVEAGVDIDMDLGFKDRSLIDSDEQLAGRINRNASKDNCIVYLFDCDKTSTIYGSDFRYKVQQSDKDIFYDYKEILISKKFHALYEKVFEHKSKNLKNIFHADNNYYKYFNNFNFPKLNSEFKLIEDNDGQQLFIPIQIPIAYFANISTLEKIEVLTQDKEFVDGIKVFEYYEKLIKLEFDEFTMKKYHIKELGSIMSQFCISIYRKQYESISSFCNPEKNINGYQYLSNWKLCYSPETGFDVIKNSSISFL